MKIDIQNFEAMQPKVASHLLKDNQAQKAINCRIEKADLRAWRRSDIIQTLTTAAYKTLYQYADGINTHWVYSAQDLDFAHSPVAGDAYKRLYYTGEAEPRAFAKDLVELPFVQANAFYKIGHAKPSAAPTGILANMASDGDFSGAGTAWTKGTGWALDDTNDEMDCDGTQTATSDLSQDVSAVDAQSYKVKYTIKNFSAGTLTPYVGDQIGTARSADGVYTETIVCDTTSSLIFRASSDFVGSIDDVSIRPVGTEYRAYVYTYVTRYGEESGPSPVLGITDYYSGDVILGGFTVPADGFALKSKVGTNEPLIRVYRTNASVAGAEYQFVGEFEIEQDTPAFNYSTGTFTDNVADANLGEVLPTELYEGIPDGLQGLVGLTSGIFAGFVGNELCMSEPYQPHAWPDEYRMSFDYNVVGIGFFGSNIIVLTEGIPYLVFGVNPEDMQKQRLQGFYPCISKRSIANTPKGVIYASYEGLILVDHDGPKNITFDYLTPGDWEAFDPATIHGQFYNGKYFGFYTGGGGFILDIENGLFTTIYDYHKAQYVSISEGKYYTIRTDYFTDVTTIEEWEGDIYNRMHFTWKSKKFILTQNTGFTCARVIIDKEMYDQVLEYLEVNQYLAAQNATAWATEDLEDPWNYGDGTAANNMMWNTTEYNGSALVNFNSIEISNEIRFTLFVDNVQVMEKNTSSDAFFRLPPIKGKRVEIQLSGFIPVRRVTIAQSPREL
jgi:hypothetical protein